MASNPAAGNARTGLAATATLAIATPAIATGYRHTGHRHWLSPHRPSPLLVIATPAIATLAIATPAVPLPSQPKRPGWIGRGGASPSREQSAGTAVARGHRQSDPIHAAQAFARKQWPAHLCRRAGNGRGGVGLAQGLGRAAT